MNEIGRPLTSESAMLFQSLSVLVLDDSPALKSARRRLFVEQQAIARLPHGRLDDVAESNAPIAGTREVDRDRLLVLIASLDQRGERLRQLVLKLRIIQ